MKKLNELFNIENDTVITGIKTNSRDVTKGDLFLCTMGVKVDRHDYIDDAISRGAGAICVSKDVGSKSVPIVKVRDTNDIAPALFQRFYDHPEDKLTIISVGGTDGKTSTATIIQTLIGDDICGYIGTNGYGCAEFFKDTNNTTPDSDKLYGYFQEFLDAGCKYVVMETSSEAFFRNRLDYLSFDSGVFTNITSEHLNTHKTFENYLFCKQQQFRKIKSAGFAVLNKDDEKSYLPMKSASNAKLILTYGKGDDNDLVIKSFSCSPTRTEIAFAYGGTSYEVISPLVGDFNVYNLAAALLTASRYVPLDKCLRNISKINIPGRYDVIDEGQDFTVVVDYAHTPNGVYRLLSFARTLVSGRIITVIGQAGERDAGKRRTVGKIVSDYSDLCFFCYEDPRNEDPVSIINDMIQDIEKDNYTIIVDREEAIKAGLNIAESGDMVLILGKGVDRYETIGNEKIPFNDEEKVKEALKSI
ncbi:MAG: UDP-N-acetylmuramoyl-L-alanyl-D-glutamate--2,6-diaminopimelate ligase [Peptostreptococcaceae bacterium]|nr:UDP-N-acetylmuramoyl-L-alanyl-D-glutamate--2,6-diaminopimelate ligase [Peptostreptococcaceae bacterium]MDY5739593.1 UDP-N-acetylmuramoyl-L-alanyl-D-glutamate--2,6-diaminopimelate ligase [Anaerovoracaceae bacterium]